MNSSAARGRQRGHTPQESNQNRWSFGTRMESAPVQTQCPYGISASTNSAPVWNQCPYELRAEMKSETRNSESRRGGMRRLVLCQQSIAQCHDIEIAISSMSTWSHHRDQKSLLNPARDSSGIDPEERGHGTWGEQLPLRDVPGARRSGGRHFELGHGASLGLCGPTCMPGLVPPYQGKTGHPRRQNSRILGVSPLGLNAGLRWEGRLPDGTCAGG